MFSGGPKLTFRNHMPRYCRSTEKGRYYTLPPVSSVSSYEKFIGIIIMGCPYRLRALNYLIPAPVETILMPDFQHSVTVAVSVKTVSVQAVYAVAAGACTR